MAKPKSRVQSAAIAGMIGVTSGAAAPATTAPVSGPGTATVPRGGEGAHPVRDHAESGVARADNALVLDPGRVVRRGRYVRPFTDDHRFHQLLSAIDEAGGVIHVPILVRVEGTPGAVEYVLVDGTHRLEAALRLGIAVPAVNLGRIAPDRALAIQAMANEVRASMHVIDQVSYVLTLLAQGLTRETVQRTTGFSTGRVSELVGIGMLLAGLTETERARARRAGHVTHRALRTLKASATDADAFRRGVLALAAASDASTDADIELDTDGDEIDVTASALGRAAGMAIMAHPDLGSKGDQIGDMAKGRGRTPLAPGGVTFVAGRNARGTSATYRLAWRARAVRQDPEAFLDRVREVLQAIAADATADYEAEVASSARGRVRRQRGGGVAAATEAWQAAIAREEAELKARVADGGGGGGGGGGGRRAETIPDDQNPIPVPPSQRRPGDPGTTISPRLLAGLSIPMLAERLKRRAPEFRALETHVSDVERQADEARRRVRERVDAEESERREEQGRGKKAGPDHPIAQ